jgi:hypothetical protein
MSETEIVKAIPCKRCAKLQRMKEVPVDAAGRPTLFFRMSCLKCSGTETYSPHDIVFLKVRTRAQTSGAA